MPDNWDSREVETSFGRPYQQYTLSQNYYLRVFKNEIREEELVWHRDYDDREVRVLQGSGWLFQFDNEIPFELTNDLVFEIDRGRYHRIIKGDGQLFLTIIEKKRPF